MKYRAVTANHSYILRIEKDEIVHDAIVRFCEIEQVSSAWFTALGAIKKIQLGYYDLQKRAYFFQGYEEDHEVVTMIGNVTKVDGKPFLHIHTTISDTKNTVYGGHLQSAYVAVTLEVHVQTFSETVERAHDDSIGLKLCAL